MSTPCARHRGHSNNPKYSHNTIGGNGMNRISTLLAVVFAMVVVVAGCDKLGGGDVALVKNGYLEFDKSITVGQAFEGYKFFTKKEWKAIKTEQGRKVIEFKGLLDLNNPNNNSPLFNQRKPSAVALVVRFIINADKTFEFADATMYGTVEDGSIQESGKLWNDYGERIVRSIYNNESITQFLALP
jgi:hypothetical protein